MRKASVVFAIATVGIAALAAAPLAAQESLEATWIGTALNGDMTGPGCGKIPFGFHYSTPILSIYRPRLTADAPVNSGLSFDAAGVSFVITSTDATDRQLHGKGTYAATAITTQAKPYQWSGDYDLKVDPPLGKGGVTLATSTVRISGTIKKLFGQNCTFQFYGAYAAIRPR
jgi:hypothetical protein